MAYTTVREKVVPSRISIDRTFYYILSLSLCILLARARGHIDVHLQHRAAEYDNSKKMTVSYIE